MSSVGSCRNGSVVWCAPLFIVVATTACAKQSPDEVAPHQVRCNVGIPMEMEGAYTAVSLGGLGICAIGMDGEVTCSLYELAEEEFVAPPAGPFDSVDVGRQSVCGLRRDGSAACWDAAGVREYDGPFRSVCAGYYDECRVLADGHPDGACGGLDGFFDVVSCGVSHVCGVERSGVVKCGQDQYEGFQSVAAEYGWCGLTSARTIECHDVPEGLGAVPAREFAQVGWGCGLTPMGEVSCWGGSGLDGSYSSIDTYVDGVCGITRAAD